jgi:hypothetical protein
MEEGAWRALGFHPVLELHFLGAAKHSRQVPTDIRVRCLRDCQSTSSRPFVVYQATSFRADMN